MTTREREALLTFIEAIGELIQTFEADEAEKFKFNQASENLQHVLTMELMNPSERTHS